MLEPTASVALAIRTCLRGLIGMLAIASLGQQSPSAGETRSETLPGSEVQFAMTFVPGGSFELGSPDDEQGRRDDEGPARTVRVDAFWMGVHEVTHDEYATFRSGAFDDESGAALADRLGVDAISRPTPPYEDPAHGMGKEGHPAVGMTRLAALRYARWLSGQTGRLYRLPTEAEWEYACEAGIGGRYGFDEGSETLDAHAWVESNSANAYHPVGQRAANASGLHDMHGNVAEWVMDEYDAGFYTSLPASGADNPLAGRPGRGRGVVRGGSFRDAAADVRCAARTPESAAWKRRDPQIPKSRWWNTDSPHVGFRLVRPAREATIEEIRDYWEDVLGEEPSPAGMPRAGGPDERERP